MALKPMFDDVVRDYDLCNRVLTWGLDKAWRRFCAAECASGKVVIDLCCGTGDLALSILDSSSFKGFVGGLDFSKAMLKKARRKNALEKRKKGQISAKHNERKGSTGTLSFILGDVAYLPLRDKSVDRIGISFALRNLVFKNPKSNTYLKEIVRVLEPRGEFVCVETSQPESLLLRNIYHLYLRKVVPFIGGLISRHKGAYQYLAVSAANFLRAEAVAELLLNAGFREVSFRHVTFGIVALHVGAK